MTCVAGRPRERSNNSASREPQRSAPHFLNSIAVIMEDMFFMEREQYLYSAGAATFRGMTKKGRL